MLYQLANACFQRQKGGSVFEMRVPCLDVFPNQFNFIVGESGCGKSTLMDALSLLLPPVRADTFLFRPVSQSPSHNVSRCTERQRLALRRAHFGFVLQSGGMIGSLTVRDNITLSAEFSGRKVPGGRLEALAARLDIAKCLSRKPGDLSGGQRQRVAIARAVLHSPPLILADEPTAAVDHDRAHDICAIFKELATESGCTTIMVTHNLELAQTFGDRTLQLVRPTILDGRLIAEVPSW